MKKKLALVTLLIFMCALAGCQGNAPAPAGSASGETALEEVTLVLDYVPNTNHTGLYVAQELGYFAEEGLAVNIVEPGDNNTSAALVAAGKGDFGVSYQEDVTYARASESPMPIKAIATIIQHNTSGFAFAKDGDIKGAADFAGKTYAGWQSPSEEAVITAVVKAAGADPSNITMVGADGSGVAQLSGDIDFIWEFKGWALAQADEAGLSYDYLPLNALDPRLDYYTPLIITNDDMIENHADTVQKFINAVKKGYEYAIANPDAAAEILSKIVPEYDLDFLKKSQAILSSEYAKDAPSWGIMTDSVWDGYTEFMAENGLIDKTIPASEQYTNAFVQN